jgi:hypothetical protein
MSSLAAALTLMSVAAAQAPAKPTPDVLIFTNGDQLTGKLTSAAGGNIVFHSDMAGDLTISFDKIKELRSGSAASQFALLKKGVPLTRQQAPEGTVTLAGGTVTLAPPAAAPPVQVKPAEVAFLIDKAAYDEAMNRHEGFFRGWNGTVTGGATIVRSTQTGTTLTAGASLVRAMPTVPWLPPRNKTLINIAESYGTLSTPVIPPTVPPTPATVVKTSIFHTGVERDEYFSPRLYALANVTLDHNFSQGLQIQEVYGGGIGWTPIQSAKQQLDLKAEVQYEEQQFTQTDGSPYMPNVNLFGSTLAETYRRNLPKKIVFTEAGTYLPGWTDTTAYSANVTASLALPVFKRLSASVSTTDNYLNNPAQYYNRNSFQFITGITYALH